MQIMFKYESLFCSYYNHLRMTYRHSVFIKHETVNRGAQPRRHLDGEPIGEKPMRNTCGQMAHALRLWEKFERDGRRFYNELKEAGSDD
jgi:hypothetical protein